jgi:hypothetical protein
VMYSGSLLISLVLMVTSVDSGILMCSWSISNEMFHQEREGIFFEDLAD